MRHPEIILFAAIAAVYTICCAPDLTWVNSGIDSFGFYLGAKWFDTLEVNYLYQVLGHLSLYFPFGADGWKLAFFLSTLPAVGCVVLVFYVVRKQTASEIAPYLASAVLAGSVIFISQSTIQETYTLATFFVVLTYTALVYNRPKLAAAALGAVWFVNWPYAVIATLVFLASNREILQRGWYIVAISLGLFAAAFSLGEDSGYWTAVLNLLGRRPVAELPMQVLWTGTLLAVSFGLGLIPAWYYLKSIKHTWPLLLLIFGPILFFLTEASYESFVQITLSCPFVAVAAGLGVEKLQVRHLEKVALGLSALFILTAPAFWDIGRSVDESPTTARQFLNQLEELPDGAIITGERGLGNPARSDWHGELNGLGARILYLETGKHVEFLSTAAYDLTNSEEKQRLSDLGYVIPTVPYLGQPYFEWMAVLSQSFADANPEVPIYWVDINKPKVFGCTVRRWR